MTRRHILQAGLATTCLGVTGNPRSASGNMRLHVPAEQAPHQCTFMQWPVSRDVYPDSGFLTIVQKTIADIANAISQFEPVRMLAASRFHQQAGKHLSEKVKLWDVETDDLWCRDAGPLFAFDETGALVVSHLQFNGWGSKQIHANDTIIAKRVAARLGLPLVASELTGEAGGVEHDGHGLLMAHESSWVNSNRNPGLSRNEIEMRLQAAYGADDMIWSPGLAGLDITDYHIDSLARFTSPGRVLLNLPDKPDMQDPFHKAAIQTRDILDAYGLTIDVIPEPDHPRINDNEFVASYANYYVCNGAVIAGQFGDQRTDKIAEKALQLHYPDREIIALNVDALGKIGGGIHCATQQMPAR